MLKTEHGCISEVRSLDYQSYTYSYFRADGQKLDFQLALPSDDIGYGIWVNWLNAYVLGDYVTMSTSGGIPVNTPTIKLFTPEGKLKLVDMEFGLTHARPTRAGMVAAKNLLESGAFVTKTYGLYLWTDGLKYQITEGTVDKAEVSPDGCKVAFFVSQRNRLSRGSNARLRVIDVCEGFGVAKDANPFKRLFARVLF